PRADPRCDHENKVRNCGAASLSDAVGESVRRKSCAFILRPTLVVACFGGSNDDNRCSDSAFAETGTLGHRWIDPRGTTILPLDDRVCEAVAAAVAPCLPEEFLAAYVYVLVWLRPVIQ